MNVVVAFGACTAFPRRSLRWYCVVTAPPWRFDGVVTECYVIQRVLQRLCGAAIAIIALLQRFHRAFLALPRRSLRCYCVVIAILWRCHGVLCNECTTKSLWERRKIALGTPRERNERRGSAMRSQAIAIKNSVGSRKSAVGAL